MKITTVFAMAISFMFFGCQKSELADVNKSQEENGIYKRKKLTILDEPIEYCGNTYQVTLTDYQQAVHAGSLIIGNDETNLYVTFQADPNWNFNSTYLYVGSADDVPGTLLPDGEGHFSPWLFPYYRWHGPGTQEYMFTVSLDELDDCFVIVGYSNALQISTNEEFIVWGKSNLKSHGFYLEYCKQECEQPQTSCETAYAFGDEVANCFIDIPGVNSNNWGWSNGPISDPSSFSWDMYAGAGKCDIDNGTLVGTLNVDYSGGVATIEYNIDPNFTLEETHLFVGEEILPRKNNGNFTTAPGQFPYSGESSYTIEGLSGDIYIAAHSVVCGEYE